MDFFIKKIFENKIDKLTHLQFQKFSRGEFKNRAMIKAKNSDRKFSINATPEYGNELVRCLAEKLGENQSKVIGVVVSTADLTWLDFQDKKHFMGVKQYRIDKEMSGNEIIELCNKFPNAFIGLSFKAEGSELKIKPKKSAKPSTKDEEKPKINFCKLKTTDREIIKGLIFDGEAENFKEIEVKHDFLINEIILPSSEKLVELGVEKNDFAKIRELAKRKGKIIRELNVDGKFFRKEKEFTA